MTKRTGGRVSGFLLVFGTLILGGCTNVLEWTVDPEDFDSHMASGRQALRDADYPMAEAEFAAAMDQQPEHSDARYYHAKAAVLNAGVDIFELVTTLTDSTSASGDGAVSVFESSTDFADAVYRVNRVVLDDLGPIHDGMTTDGTMGAGDVGVDLAVAFTLRGILRLRDTNADGFIDAFDIPIEDFALAGDDGDFSLDGLENLPPEDLNSMIDDVDALLEDGGDLLTDILDGTGVDVEDLDGLIDDLGGDLSAYYINTGVPGNSGEGDNDGDGLIDEECLNGLDDDGDGVVDEDSRIIGCTGGGA
ncbi:MAG: hypothetical protein CME07_00880 [Gemmatimonadetes bacterium]|nr:hypothetical protein [Gemmatimonadota bacterium]